MCASSREFQVIDEGRLRTTPTLASARCPGMPHVRHLSIRQAHAPNFLERYPPPCEIGNSAGWSCRDSRYHFTPRAELPFWGGSWGGSSWSEIKSRAMLLQGVDCVSSVFAAVVMMLSLESGNAAGHQAGGMVGFSDLPPILVFAFLFRCLFRFITQHIPSPI